MGFLLRLTRPSSLIGSHTSLDADVVGPDALLFALLTSSHLNSPATKALIIIDELHRQDTGTILKHDRRSHYA